MIRLLMIAFVGLSLSGFAEYIALTDAKTVEVFDDTGAKTSTLSLIGSGAAAGTNLIGVTYGNFRGNGNELILLRDSGNIEYYADPLTASGSLTRLGWGALERVGRVVKTITTYVGGTNLVCHARDGESAPYVYEYDGSLAGAYLDRIDATLVGGALNHAPYISLAVGDDLHATAGEDWAFLGEDGWVEVYSDSTVGGAFERVAYFNASVTPVDIRVISDNQYAILDESNTVNFFSFSGSAAGGDISLDTTSTLIGFVFQEGASVDLDPDYIALTDSFSVELFASNGVRTATFSLTGSGAVDGTNLISAAYGNFRTNGTELIVLRDDHIVEYYADPLTATGDTLIRLGYNSLEDGGRSIAGIATFSGDSNLVAAVNPAANSGTYGYEYDGSLAGGVTLDRINTPSVSSGFHAPYVSLVVGQDLHATPGPDWAFLGEDGFVEVFADSPAGGAYERQSYFNAAAGAVEISLTEAGEYVVLYDDNTVKLWSLFGTDTGKGATLNTASTLVGFDVLPEIEKSLETFDVWVASYGEIGSETNDFDGDGLDNLYEYASGGDPTDPDDNGYPVSAQIVMEDSTNWFEYVYARRTTTNSGLTYVIVQCADLPGGSWTNTGEAVEVGAGVLDADFESVTNHIPMVGKTREFISHQISK